MGAIAAVNGLGMILRRIELQLEEVGGVDPPIGEVAADWRDESKYEVLK